MKDRDYLAAEDLGANTGTEGEWRLRDVWSGLGFILLGGGSLWVAVLAEAHGFPRWLTANSWYFGPITVVLGVYWVIRALGAGMER